jgi:hypothetical protein
MSLVFDESQQALLEAQISMNTVALSANELPVYSSPSTRVGRALNIVASAQR